MREDTNTTLSEVDTDSLHPEHARLRAWALNVILEDDSHNAQESYLAVGALGGGPDEDAWQDHRCVRAQPGEWFYWLDPAEHEASERVYAEPVDEVDAQGFISLYRMKMPPKATHCQPCHFAPDILTILEEKAEASHARMERYNAETQALFAERARINAEFEAQGSPLRVKGRV